MDDLPSIECVANGPLRVKGLAALRNSKGEALPTQAVTALCRCDQPRSSGASPEPYTLCRCGASKNKPFKTSKRDAAPCDRSSTSSANSRSEYATVKPSALAVFRLFRRHVPCAPQSELRRASRR